MVKSFVMSVAILFLFVTLADAQVLRMRRAARTKTVVTQKSRKVVAQPQFALNGKCRIVNGKKVCGQ